MTDEFESSAMFTVILATIVWALKPEEFFEGQQLRQWGVKRGQTVVPAWLFLLVISLMFYKNEMRDLANVAF